MAEEMACARLCQLLGNAFVSHPEILYATEKPGELSFFTSEEDLAGMPMVPTVAMEKDFLIYLTQVYREVQRWTLADSICEEVALLETINGEDCSWHKRPPTGSQSCLCSSISLLIVFLGSKSQHVRHMATKVLVVISSFLLKYERKWRELAHLLWTRLGAEIQIKSSWHVAAALMEALQLVHKSLKNENNDLAETNMEFVLQSILNFQWKFLHEVSDAPNIALISADAIEGLFLGATLRLLCSIVEKTAMESGSRLLDDASMYIKVTTLFYDLLVYCLSVYCRFNVGFSQYIRHKSLVLMIRLSNWNHWHRYALESCVQLLQTYYKDIMVKPITGGEINSCIVSPLEGSPFFTCFSLGATAEEIFAPHLRRQTLFLYVKCCYGSFWCMSGFNGLSELSKWIQGHMTLGRKSDGHDYRRFSLSFLQLFMDEDDLLFEILLLLLDTPSLASYNKKKFEHINSDQWRRDIAHIWNVFNPFCVLHTFLHLIHYDHSVLLDYLISKDSGISCIQYLLRCLRLVCESWQAFSEASMVSSTEDHGAKQCLLSLKMSMESLHQRGLFPYNPSPLLKRFARFQELCMSV